MTDAVFPRLEPDPRPVVLREGASLPVADAAWLLARQWWVGEMQAADGGVRVAGFVEHEWLALLPADGGRDGTPEQKAADLVPSEAVAAPVAGWDWRARLLAGRPVLRALEADLAQMWDLMRRVPDPSGNLRGSAQAAGRRLRETVAAHTVEADAPALRRIPPGRRPDGIALAATFAADRLPWPAGAAAERLGRIASGEGGKHSFSPERGRHDGRLPAGDGGDQTVTIVDAPGPRLEGSDLAGPATLDGALDQETGTTVARLTYAGSVPGGWWRFDAAEHAWTAVPAGPSVLGRLLVAAGLGAKERAMWLLPFDVPAGGMLALRTVRVVDGFGRGIDAVAGAPPDRRSWTDGGALGWMPLLPEGSHLAGADVEVFTFVADGAENFVGGGAPGPGRFGARPSAPGPAVPARGRRPSPYKTSLAMLCRRPRARATASRCASRRRTRGVHPCANFRRARARRSPAPAAGRGRRRTCCRRRWRFPGPRSGPRVGGLGPNGAWRGRQTGVERYGRCAARGRCRSEATRAWRRMWRSRR